MDEISLKQNKFISLSHKYAKEMYGYTFYETSSEEREKIFSRVAKDMRNVNKKEFENYKLFMDTNFVADIDYNKMDVLSKKTDVYMFCSECGRKLLIAERTGIKHCPVHIEDMTPVTSKHPMAKYFRSLKGPGW